ncbi:hypothetical protein ACFQXB_11555 [Plastorhodobacter daqingensis]|uniref:Uncharacterized protein n=1 Tax=Plastorhodobacter daqingensis TaxID=1387281 RepID=A0ABW2UMR5_9RHOB
MTNRMPPVPPENRSDKGPGDPGTAARDTTPDRDERDRNTAQQGRQGDIKQNTTNQGYQTNR